MMTTPKRGRHTPMSGSRAVASTAAAPLTELKVVVRVRSHGESMDEAEDSTVTVLSDERSVHVRLLSAPGPFGRGRSFVFDQAFGPGASQSDIFESVGKPLCAVLRGHICARR